MTRLTGRGEPGCWTPGRLALTLGWVASVGLLLAACSATTPNAAHTQVSPPPLVATPGASVSLPASPSASSSPTPSATASSASTAPLAPPAAVTACRLDSLEAELTSVTADTGGEETAFVELRNPGTAACTLEGYPTLELLSATGATLPATTAESDAYRLATVTLTPGSAPITPGHPAAGHGYLAILYNGEIGPHGQCTSAQLERPSSVLITQYPQRSGVTVSATAPAGPQGPARSITSCGGALAVSAFTDLAGVQGGG